MNDTVERLKAHPIGQLVLEYRAAMQALVASNERVAIAMETDGPSARAMAAYKADQVRVEGIEAKLFEALLRGERW